MEVPIMTVERLMQKLEKFPKNAIVVYAIDDEGNAYHPIYNEPITMKLSDIEDSLYPHEKIPKGVKIVCVN